MPKFILDSGGYVRVSYPFADGTMTIERTFETLDLFTRGYIEALFFTEESPGVSTREFLSAAGQRRLADGTLDGSLPGDVGFADLAPQTLEEIIGECRQFQEEAAALLEEAYSLRGYDATQAGRDFWYTRNGHGVGYWDRSVLDGRDLGDRLSELARQAGNVDAYLGDDRKVYLS